MSTSSSKCTDSSFSVICETVEDFVENEQIGWSFVTLKSDNVSKNAIDILPLNDFRRVDHLMVTNKTIGRITHTSNCHYGLHLKYISVFDSKLSILSKNSFYSGVALERLHLVNNQIEMIEPGAFGYISTPNMKFIDLSNNLIEVLQSGIFNYNGTTEIIVLKNNKIVYIETNTFPDNLRILNLDNNELRDLQGVSNMQKLQIIYLNNNKLLKVPRFSNLLNLEEIELSHNQITSILDDPFENLKKLRILDLSHNKLIRVKFLENVLIKNVKTDHPTLYISLAFNHLTELEFGLDVNTTLEANLVILFGNPWSCTDWETIEQYIQTTKIKRSNCDERYFDSGVFPYCVVPLEPVTDVLLFREQNKFKDHFTDLVNKGKELNCTLKLERNMETSLKIYKPSWRRCFGESVKVYNY